LHSNCLHSAIARQLGGGKNQKDTDNSAWQSVLDRLAISLLSFPASSSCSQHSLLSSWLEIRELMVFTVRSIDGRCCSRVATSAPINFFLFRLGFQMLAWARWLRTQLLTCKHVLSTVPPTFVALHPGAGGSNPADFAPHMLASSSVFDSGENEPRQRQLLPCQDLLHPPWVRARCL
jgi:hypothetical protein